MKRVIILCRLPDRDRCLKHSAKLGESPLFGDKDAMGWMEYAQQCVVHDDHPMTHNMARGIERANHFNVPIIHRIINTDHQ